MKIAAVTKTAVMAAGTERKSGTGIVTGTLSQCGRRSETGGIATKTAERDKRRPSNSQ